MLENFALDWQEAALPEDDIVQARFHRQTTLIIKRTGEWSAKNEIRGIFSFACHFNQSRPGDKLREAHTTSVKALVTRIFYMIEQLQPHASNH